jgi:ABC-2 type transport system ATP-binding protein
LTIGYDNNMTNNSDYAISLKKVSKEYTIHHEKPTLVERFFKGRDEKFLALNNINLKIRSGETVGIIGDNGSGKTTLLKIIAGVTSPTKGDVSTHGKVVSLIDLEAGFYPDLTGIQNIYLNAMFLGLTKKEVDKKLDSIIAFAGVRQFIDAPFFTYSQGMKLRLGFSAAIHSDPDILLLDENFSVGDDKFKKKCIDTIKKFKKQKKTILIVSQWKLFVKQNCRRIITFKRGKIVSDTHS